MEEYEKPIEEIFNMYYINFDKVFEIKSIFNNEVKTSKTKEKIKNNEKTNEKKYNLSFDNGKINNILSLKNGIEYSELYKNSETIKMNESIEIKNTKSTYLREIIQNCIEVDKNVKIGDLVKLNKLNLELINEEELRMVKLLMNGFLDGIKINDSNEINIDKIFKAMLKDYSYKLKGKLNEKEYVIKIPISLENEFENFYNIDDLLLSELTLIGIYKGKVKASKLKNTFQFFMENDTSNDYQEIKDSQNTQVLNKTRILENDKEYEFIDIISIIQTLNIKRKEVKKNEKNTGLFKKIFFWIKKRICRQGI